MLGRYAVDGFTFDSIMKPKQLIFSKLITNMSRRFAGSLCFLCYPIWIVLGRSFVQMAALSKEQPGNGLATLNPLMAKHMHKAML